MPERRVFDGRDVDGRELRPGHVGVGLEVAIHEDRVTASLFVVCRARRPRVHRGHLKQEAQARRELRERVVHRQVLGAEPHNLGHVSAASSVAKPGRAAARFVRAQAIASRSGTPVHSSMKVFLNSSANTQPMRG